MNNLLKEISLRLHPTKTDLASSIVRVLDEEVKNAAAEVGLPTTASTEDIRKAFTKRQKADHKKIEDDLRRINLELADSVSYLNSRTLDFNKYSLDPAKSPDADITLQHFKNELHNFVGKTRKLNMEKTIEPVSRTYFVMGANFANIRRIMGGKSNYPHSYEEFLQDFTS